MRPKMLTHHIFRKFVEQLHESENVDSFRIAMAEAAEAFDLPCFAYAHIPANAEHRVNLISTYPTSWTDHYL